MSKFKSYLEDASQKKRISIEIRDWEIGEHDFPNKVVTHKIEGDSLAEFFMDFERKFHKRASEKLKSAMLELMNDAMERAQKEGSHEATIDAAITDKKYSKEKIAEITGRSGRSH